MDNNKTLSMIMAYKNTFSGSNGQDVLEDLERQCDWKMPDRCFDPESDRRTCFNLGKLSIIRYIHGKMGKKLPEEKVDKAVHKEIING